MSKLDYSASVPFVEGAPFSVDAGSANNPPGDRFVDFKPNTSVVVKKAPTKLERKDYMRRPVARYEVDYISPEAARLKRQNEKERILEIARAIYKDEENKRLNYKEAKALIAKCKKEDFDEPTKEIRRALKIVEKHIPMTKEQAVEKATIQFYNISN